MANITPNFKLIKPSGTDAPDIANINANMDIIDEQLKVATDLSEIWKTLFPVGYVYISISSTSPATLFGGTWKKVDDNAVLKTGGTAGSMNGSNNLNIGIDNLPSHVHNMSHTHTITVTGGNHNHTYNAQISSFTTTSQVAGAGIVSTSNPTNNDTSYSGNLSLSGTTNSSSISHTEAIGSGTPLTLNPLNLRVNMWIRTA